MISASVAPSRKRGIKPLSEGGIVLICADDDAIIRLGYLGLARRLEGVKEYKILGKTYEEANSLVSKVLDAAEEHGEENVVCVFDLHMENYDGQGEVLGSDVVCDLRIAGFNGLAIIRTGNEDDMSKDMCRRAGADEVLNKRMSCGQVVDVIIRNRGTSSQERRNKRTKVSLLSIQCHDHDRDVVVVSIPPIPDSNTGKENMSTAVDMPTNQAAVTRDSPSRAKPPREHAAERVQPAH